MLIAVAGPVFFALPAGLQETVRHILYPARWPLALLVGIALVTNVYQIWTKRAAAPPPPKPRPTHLRVVRDDETLH